MNTQRLRQIAILVDSLDTTAADRLLDSLPAELQQRVRDAVMDLDRVTDSERQYVLNEFRRGRASGGGPGGDGGSLGATGSSPTMGGSAAGTSPSTYRPARGPAPPSNPVSNPWPVTEPTGDAPSMPGGVDWSASARRPAAPVGSSAGTYSDPSRDEWAPGWPTAPAVALASAGTGSGPGPEAAAAGSIPAGPRLAGQTPPLDLADTLAAVDLDALAAVVLRESPPVLAAVLSLLPPLKAAQLLDLCPASLQTAALQRLQHLTELDDEIVGLLQQELQTVIRQRQKLRQRQRVGATALTEILVAAQRLQSTSVSQAVQTQLQGRRAHPDAVMSNPAYPAPLRPTKLAAPTDWPAEDSFAASAASVNGGASSMPVSLNAPGTRAAVAPGQTSPTDRPVERRAGPSPDAAADTTSESRLVSAELDHEDALADMVPRFEFTELVRCDNASLQALLATAKPQLTLLALRGAEPALLERVLRMLPRSEANEVRFRVQNIGPTRIHDIQQAQQYLLRLASLLEDLGRFRRPTSGSRWRAVA